MNPKLKSRLLFVALAAAVPAFALAADPPRATTPPPASLAGENPRDVDTTPAPAVDNTGINERDKNDATTTAEDQPNNKSDIALEASVRRAVVDDASLSTLAHNIKIVTADGVVTLRGPVQTTDERKRIATLVAKTDGVKRVDNKLDVKQR